MARLLHPALCWLCRTAWMWPPVNNSFCNGGLTVRGYCVEAGWLSYMDWQRHGWFFFPIDFVWFWIKNTSVFIPLLIAAQFDGAGFRPSSASGLRRCGLWFVVPTSSSFSHGTGTTRSSSSSGALRQHLSQPDRRHRTQVAGGTMVAAALWSLGLSGARIWCAHPTPTRALPFIDTNGLQLAEWCGRTRPRTPFLPLPTSTTARPTLSAGAS